LARCDIGERIMLLDSRAIARAVRVVLDASGACAAFEAPAPANFGCSAKMLPLCP
jgi:hypothetical protein